MTVSLALNMKYNYSIMDVSAKVQEKVKSAVENMTGLEVADVNVKWQAWRWRVRSLQNRNSLQKTGQL